jgi:hypothetical protein
LSASMAGPPICRMWLWVHARNMLGATYPDLDFDQVP